MTEMCPIRYLPITAVELEGAAFAAFVNPAIQILLLHQAAIVAETALDEVPEELKPRVTEYAVSLYFRAGYDEDIRRLGASVQTAPGCPYRDSIDRMLGAIGDPNYFYNFWNS